jgi:hypothetical protein
VFIVKYKFLNSVKDKIKSNSGNQVWEVGNWYKHEEISMCNSGFHCSKTILDAMSYVKGEILAEVKTKGEHESQSDKEVWQEMKIVKAYKWTKKDSVALSIFSAELVLKNYEKLYPDDKRPREAIEAAKKVLENDNEENRSAAWSAAESAWSAAWSARSAAWSAESAAESAAWSAESAAESAAWSAESAAESAARSAAWSAARINKKINKWLVNHLKDMEIYDKKKI